MVDDPVITAQEVDTAIQAFSARMPKEIYDVRHDILYQAMLDALTVAARVKANAANS